MEPGNHRRNPVQGRFTEKSSAHFSRGRIARGALLVVSAGLAGLTGLFEGLVPFPALWEILNTLIGIGVTGVLFALIFKLVPDVKVAWKDVWVGGLVTAVAFAMGRIALAWYVGRSATVSPFGAAGSLVALIVWVYYSAQILFMGAEFAQVYASRYGAPIVPSPNAVPIDAEAPAKASHSAHGQA